MIQSIKTKSNCKFEFGNDVTIFYVQRSTVGVKFSSNYVFHQHLISIFHSKVKEEKKLSNAQQNEWTNNNIIYIELQNCCPYLQHVASFGSFHPSANEMPECMKLHWKWHQTATTSPLIDKRKECACFYLVFFHSACVFLWAHHRIYWSMKIVRRRYMWCECMLPVRKSLDNFKHQTLHCKQTYAFRTTTVLLFLGLLWVRFRTSSSIK